AATRLSMDGGLTFGGLNAAAASGAATAESGMQLGWKLRQTLALGDFLRESELAERTRMELQIQSLEPAFASGGMLLDRGRFTLAAQLAHQLGKNDSLLLRHDLQIAALPRLGPTQADIDA